MKLSRCAVFLATLLFLMAPAAHAGDPADVYFGYSRVGANLYAPYTPGMNGWQLAAYLRTFPFVGVEGDVSHYGATAGAGSEHATLYMFGPRVTLGAGGYSVFAHVLGGVAHVSSNAVMTLPATATNATSYALGGGVDIPLYHPLKLRVMGDYLGYGNAPSSRYSPSHFRIGVGVAYHF